MTLKELVAKYGEEWCARTLESVLKQRERARETAKKNRAEFKKFLELRKKGQV